MEFTPEERECIDRELRIADEWQIRNGNKLIPFEEVFDRIFDDIKKEREDYRI